MLNINNLTIKYDKTIINDANLSFEEGQITVIKGESGSGKTSILNVIGLMRTSECQYYINDINVGALTQHEKSHFRLKNIGFVFQQNNLLEDFTAIENVEIPMIINNSENTKNKAGELIDFVGLAEETNKTPNHLSGGQEQRVAIARAMANDALIILADEPTAALDSGNREKVLELFIRLAHEKNKIVIIVSHDEEVSKIADKIYEIKGEKVECIEQIKDKPNDDIKRKHSNINFGEHNIAVDKKCIKNNRFYAFYNKNKMGDKKLNRGLVCITTVIAMIAMLFLNFGDDFTQRQENFVNAISDRSLFVVNDVMGLNTKTDYLEALALTQEEIDIIKKVPGITKIYPYYNFTSSGYTESKKETESKEVSKISVQNKGNIIADFSGEDFAVIPMYPEEDLKYMSQYGNEDFSEGAVLTYSLAKQLSDNLQELIGKSIVIECFVPTKLYDTYATKTNRKDNNENNKIKIDMPINKNIEITKKITGILSDEYTVLRTEGVQDCVLLEYDQMNDILTQNLSQDIIEEQSKFPQKKYMPSALTVFSDDYSDVSNIKTKIQSISPTYNVSCAAIDVDKIKSNIGVVKTVMTFVTILIIVISIIMFATLYYLKNRSRKKEIGILRALGLTQNNVRTLFLREMFAIALKAFIASVILAELTAIVINMLMSMEMFSITATSILLGFVLSVVVVLISGVIPVLRVSKTDPVEAIQQGFH